MTMLTERRKLKLKRPDKSTEVMQRKEKEITKKINIRGSNFPDSGNCSTWQKPPGESHPAIFQGKLVLTPASNSPEL